MANCSEPQEQKIINSSHSFKEDIFKSRIGPGLVACVAETMEAWEESLITLSQRIADLASETEISKIEILKLKKENDNSKIDIRNLNEESDKSKTELKKLKDEIETSKMITQILKDENWILGIEFRKLTEHKEQISSSCVAILKRLEMQLDLLESNPIIPKPNNLDKFSQESTAVDSATAEPKVGIEEGTLVIAAVPEHRNITDEDTDIAPVSEYLLLGNDRDYIQFCRPSESVDPAALSLVDLRYVLIAGQELLVFLGKCPNLKVLRLIHLHFSEEVTGKVELNHLEEFHLCRSSGAESRGAYIDGLSATIEALDSQILFTKKGSTGNLFDLKARIKVELYGTQSRHFIFDPKYNNLVSSMTCTSSILEKYIKSRLHNKKLTKLALGSCEIRLENAGVKKTLMGVRELNLFHVAFYNNSGILKDEAVFGTLNSFGNLNYYTPSRDDPSMALSGISLMPFPVKIPEPVPRIKNQLGHLVIKCQEFRCDSSNLIYSIPSPRVVYECTCSVSSKAMGECNIYPFLYYVLIWKSPAADRAQWIWVRGFSRLQRPPPVFQSSFFTLPSICDRVHSFLNLHIPTTCNNFTLDKESSGVWLVHENTEDQIKDLEN